MDNRRALRSPYRRCERASPKLPRPRLFGTPKIPCRAAPKAIAFRNRKPLKTTVPTKRTHGLRRKTSAASSPLPGMGGTRPASLRSNISIRERAARLLCDPRLATFAPQSLALHDGLAGDVEMDAIDAGAGGDVEGLAIGSAPGKIGDALGHDDCAQRLAFR